AITHTKKSNRRKDRSREFVERLKAVTAALIKRKRLAVTLSLVGCIVIGTIAFWRHLLLVGCLILGTVAFWHQSKRYRVKKTSDRFASVRSSARVTDSNEVRKVYYRDIVTCQSVVKGEEETTSYGKSDDWIYCPCVGGYIFSNLLDPVE